MRNEMVAESPLEGRFEALDVNNYGRIVRGEWRGRSDRFEVLDRNNDGVISPTKWWLREMSVNEPVHFRGSEAGQSSVQREWQWSQRVFTDQDTNRDGFVSREEFWSPGEATGTSGYADNRTVNSPVVLRSVRPSAGLIRVSTPESEMC